MDTQMIFVTKPSTVAKAAEKELKAQLNAQKSKVGKFIFAIGGDGTMLHAIRQHMGKKLPFIGISAGRLGFLQTVEANQISELIKSLRGNRYSVIEAPLLLAKQGKKQLGFGFNDISIERSGSRAAKFDLQIGNSTGSFIGDGVIFSTPLGSTAYNLATGGPIIDSLAQDVFVVTPNNPHISVLYSSLQRPHILNKSRRVVIKVDHSDAKERPAKVIIDGHTVVKNLSGSIQVALSQRTVKLVELKPDDFVDRIENKRLGRY